MTPGAIFRSDCASWPIADVRLASSRRRRADRLQPPIAIAFADRHFVNASFVAQMRQLTTPPGFCCSASAARGHDAQKTKRAKNIFRPRIADRIYDISRSGCNRLHIFALQQALSFTAVRLTAPRVRKSTEIRCRCAAQAPRCTATAARRPCAFVALDFFFAPWRAGHRQ
jgi:hypothetical protein